MPVAEGEGAFRQIFRQVHAGHAGCLDDEWLMRPCRLPDGSAAGRPVVWSRRNGPWRDVDVLWVGAAPGNAGGMGGGRMGAHGTRIPFGGDIAGGNVDVLLSAAGLDRNRTFIVAALNQLPERGGGEPTVAEIRRPVGAAPSSLHVLRDTILAAGPRLVACLGTIGLRSTIAAARLDPMAGRLTLPGPRTLEASGIERGRSTPWPRAIAPDDAFQSLWTGRWSRPPPHVLWLLHPSAQNMSPYAGAGTVFYRRMIETISAVRRAMTETLGLDVPAERPRPPVEGIYALPEWTAAVGPRHAELDRLWRARGV
jgi:uracil-DNA glycosylase